MKKLICFLLIISLCSGLIGCGGNAFSGYEVISRLDSEQFTVAFRSGDNLCTIITAALQEIASEGLISRLSSQYLGSDYSCLQGYAGAISAVTVEIPQERNLVVGVQDGARPLCWMDENGCFAGLIPDLVQAAADKLGWTVTYRSIESDDTDIELASGNVDCAWLPAAFDASTGKYSLSPGWMENSHLVIVRKGSGITKLKALKNRNLGVMDDTALASFNANGPEKIIDTVTVWYYEDLQRCFDALASGNCDAIVIDSIAASSYMY